MPSSIPILSTLVNAPPGLSGSCQSNPPTHPEKVGDLQGITIMEKLKPTFKFLGHANKINIEKFMERMEVKMEGVSDK